MKEFLYSLHSKLSLFSALLSLRLSLFEAELWPRFLCWEYVLNLENRDSVIFFPYIVRVGGIKFNPANRSCGIRHRAVRDPVNIIAYGASPKEFIKLLQRANQKWKQFMGSSYFLHGSSGCGWHASIAIKIDIDEQARERHHIRLFGLKTRQGEKITLCAAHYDKPYHSEQEAPLSWNETRNIVSINLAHLPQNLTEPISERDWRGAEGDGKILIINCKP